MFENVWVMTPAVQDSDDEQLGLRVRASVEDTVGKVAHPCPTHLIEPFDRWSARRKHLKPLNCRVDIGQEPFAQLRVDLRVVVVSTLEVDDCVCGESDPQRRARKCRWTSDQS